MEKKALLKLLVILLALSYAAAVPATRSPVTRKVDPSVQDNQAKEDLAMHLRNSEELFDMKEEELKEGRMMMDIADYPGTRANPAHDPKSPGKP